MAFAKAQPVPWVERDRCRSALNTSCSIPPLEVKLNRSVAFSKCPPVMTMADRPHLMKLVGGQAHFVEIRHFETSKDGRFVHVWRQDGGQRYELLNKQFSSWNV